MEMNKETFAESAPTLESGALMQRHERGIFLENQVKEYKSVTLAKVQSQLRHCGRQLFCLEPIDPRLAVVSWMCAALTIKVKYQFLRLHSLFRIYIRSDYIIRL